MKSWKKDMTHQLVWNTVAMDTSPLVIYRKTWIFHSFPSRKAAEGFTGAISLQEWYQRVTKIEMFHRIKWNS